MAEYEKFFSSLCYPSESALAASDADTPIQALRFIDQIDCYLWQAASDEVTVLQSISTCFTSAPAISWYNQLLASRKPRPMTIDALRRALMREFGVDRGTQEDVLARYSLEYHKDNENGGYFHSQEFKLKLNYIDEIESLKEQVKFRNRRALEQQTELAQTSRRWKSIVVKREAKHASQLKKKDAHIARLEEKLKESEQAIKGLMGMVASRPESADVRIVRLGAAFDKFQNELAGANERLKRELHRAAKPPASEYVARSPEKKETPRAKVDAGEVRSAVPSAKEENTPAPQRPQAQFPPQAQSQPAPKAVHWPSSPLLERRVSASPHASCASASSSPSPKVPRIPRFQPDYVLSLRRSIFARLPLLQMRSGNSESPSPRSQIPVQNARNAAKKYSTSFGGWREMVSPVHTDEKDRMRAKPKALRKDRADVRGKAEREVA